MFDESVISLMSGGTVEVSEQVVRSLDGVLKKRLKGHVMLASLTTKVSFHFSTTVEGGGALAFHRQF